MSRIVLVNEMPWRLVLGSPQKNILQTNHAAAEEPNKSLDRFEGCIDFKFEGNSQVIYKASIRNKKKNKSMQTLCTLYNTGDQAKKGICNHKLGPLIRLVMAPPKLQNVIFS